VWQVKFLTVVGVGQCVVSCGEDGRVYRFHVRVWVVWCGGRGVCGVLIARVHRRDDAFVCLQVDESLTQLISRTEIVDARTSTAMSIACVPGTGNRCVCCMCMLCECARVGIAS
jgi:hypothetical protein